LGKSVQYKHIYREKKFKLAIFWEKVFKIAIFTGKKSLNSPYLDLRFFLCMLRVYITGFSLIYSQIWLYPLVDDRPSTYLTDTWLRLFCFGFVLEGLCLVSFLLHTRYLVLLSNGFIAFLMMYVTLTCGFSFVTEKDLERCKFLCVYVITVTAAAAKFGSSVWACLAHKRVFPYLFFVGWVCTTVLFFDCLGNLLDVMIIILL